MSSRQHQRIGIGIAPTTPNYWELAGSMGRLVKLADGRVKKLDHERV